MGGTGWEVRADNSPAERQVGMGVEAGVLSVRPGGGPGPPTGYPGEAGGGGVGRAACRTELLLSKLLEAVCSLPLF